MGKQFYLTYKWDPNTPGQNGPRSNGNKGVLYFPQSSMTRALLSHGLVSYPGNLLEESYPSAEMQLVYSTAPANWAEQMRRRY